MPSSVWWIVRCNETTLFCPKMVFFGVCTVQISISHIRKWCRVHTGGRRPRRNWRDSFSYSQSCLVSIHCCSVGSSWRVKILGLWIGTWNSISCYVYCIFSGVDVSNHPWRQLPLRRSFTVLCFFNFCSLGHGRRKKLASFLYIACFSPRPNKAPQWEFVIS